MKNIYTVLMMLAVVLFQGKAHAGSAYSGNAIDDTFTIKTIEGKEATVQGKPKTLKVGDNLFFIRSPFQFSVTAIKGDEVTIALPERHDLKVGQNLVRNMTESMKKAMDTEHRLKQALEE